MSSSLEHHADITAVLEVAANQDANDSPGAVRAGGGQGLHGYSGTADFGIMAAPLSAHAGHRREDRGFIVQRRYW